MMSLAPAPFPRALFVLLAPLFSYGVCLNGHPSVDNEYKGSKAVLLAVVAGQRNVPEASDGFFLEGTAYRLKIERIFHGKLANSPEVFSENSSGRFPMVVGSKYLLFIHEEDGRLLVNNCGNSGLASERGAELRAIERLSAGKR
jgi:hypothetical protein